MNKTKIEDKSESLDGNVLSITVVVPARGFFIGRECSEIVLPNSLAEQLYDAAQEVKHFSKVNRAIVTVFIEK